MVGIKLLTLEMMLFESAEDSLGEAGTSSLAWVMLPSRYFSASTMGIALKMPPL